MQCVMEARTVGLAILLLALPFAARAECLDEHLRGAIALNQLRAPQYAALSGGRSHEVSTRLVESEKRALIPAGLAMWGTRYWRKHGVPVLCSEFESMTLVGAPIHEASRERPSLEAYLAPDAKPLVTDLQVILDWELSSPDATRVAWSAIEGRLQLELESISGELRFNCMYRHLVDSMIRTARQAPQLVRLARSKGLRSPEPWSIRLLKEHFQALSFSIELDRLAAPIQADGIPIVCNDVPPL